MNTYGDIRARFEMAMNEAKQPNKTAIKDFWLDGFKKFMKSKDFAGVSSRKGDTGEVLRANFGANDGTAEQQITKFLEKIGKLKAKEYEIEMLPLGVVSNDYHGYKITISKKTTDALGKTYKPGDSFVITNRYKIGKDGAASVINRKDLTPDALKITTNEYKSAESLLSVIKPAINSLSYPGSYTSFIIDSTEELINNTKNRNMFANFEEYANSNLKGVEYKISDKLFEGIDQLSINNFQNDFGEILGGFAAFNMLKDYGTGLSYPTASNERLVDFYFDGYSVSSKAGSGGTPSGETIIKKIYQLKENSIAQPEDTLEMDFFTQVVEAWINPPKLASSGIYNNIMNLAAINIQDRANSGYWYLIEKTGLSPQQLKRKTVEAYLDELAQDPTAFADFLTNLWNRSGMAWNDKKLNQYVTDYAKMGNKRIGVVFYPIMVEVAKILNELYQTPLTRFGQMATDVKQLYLDVVVKRGVFIFKMVPFKTATFKFEQKGSMSNPFNANLGIKILK